MRHFSFACAVTLCLMAACPAWAAQPVQTPENGTPRADAPKTADVLEYIRLYGYREMLELGAERQLANIIEVVRQTTPDLAPGVLELIHKELRGEVKAASEESVREMAAVFQRRLTREDVAYLVSVGRDARMQKVVRLQPKLAQDMEPIAERLAERVTSKAAPRIQERLQQLEGGQAL